MNNRFLISEILEMNVTEERHGAAFYQALSETAKHPLIQQKAAEIAKQEHEHEIRFARLRDEFELGESDNMIETEEFQTYLETLSGNKIFPNEDAAITTAARLSDKEALEFALKTEFATLQLLQELKQHIDEAHFSVIDETIHEEEQHINQLETLKRSIA